MKKSLLLSALLICSVAACKKKDEAAKAETPSAKTESAPAESAAPAAPAARGEAVDICAKISKEDIESSVGTLTGDPMPTPAQGSLLGMCNWMTDAGMASVSARPVNEYDATVSAYAEGSSEVAGIGEKTVATKVGHLIKPAGKPFMLQVMVTAGGKPDPVKSEALAKVAVEKL